MDENVKKKKQRKSTTIFPYQIDSFDSARAWNDVKNPRAIKMQRAKFIEVFMETCPRLHGVLFMHFKKFWNNFPLDIDLPIIHVSDNNEIWMTWNTDTFIIKLKMYKYDDNLVSFKFDGIETKGSFNKSFKSDFDYDDMDKVYEFIKFLVGLNIEKEK